MTYITQQLPAAILNVGLEREDDEEGLELVKTDGGFIVTDQRYSQSRLKYRIDLRPYRRDQSVTAAVIAQFKATRGGEHTFPLLDCSPDHSTLTAEEIGTGDDATTTFQITKSWTVGGLTQTRKVTRPVTGMQVFLDGVEQLSGVTVDEATGIVTFSSPPTAGQVVTVTGTFYIPVRFSEAMVAVGLANHLEQFETLELEEDFE